VFPSGGPDFTVMSNAQCSSRSGTSPPTHTPYHDPGGDYFTGLNPQKARNNAVGQLERPQSGDDPSLRRNQAAE
jgi:hypothetical protein